MSDNAPVDVAALMAAAKRTIEEKKRQLGINREQSREPNRDVEDKNARLMALKARIAAQSASAQITQSAAQLAQHHQLMSQKQEQYQLQHQQMQQQQQHQMMMQQQQQQQQQQKQQDASSGSMAAPAQPPPSQHDREKLLNLIIDSEGRTIDKRTGELVQIESFTPTLKANIKAQKTRVDTRVIDATKKSSNSHDLFSSGFTSMMSGAASSLSASVSSASLASASAAAAAAAQASADTMSEQFFDPRLKMKTAVRNKRKMVFNEKGKYEDIGNKLRTKSKLQMLQQEIASISKKTGISSESRLALLQPKRALKETVPNVEWWDYAIINELNYDSLDKWSESELKEKLKLTRLIEHPVQMKPPINLDKKVVPAVMLTKKERKKMRRQSRAEALKEQQEKIRLGLMPPPEPKVKISNLMRVLGTEAVQDPTKVEEYVRNQMAKRQKMHEEQNESRKLTDAERGEKKQRKIMENTTVTGVHVAVYRVKDLSDPAVKFKVESNCNQLHMTGIVLLCKSLNVVVVEGGPKQQRKFKRLMLNRIKWADLIKKKSSADADSDGTPREKNQCSLVWEGTIKSRIFGNIIFKMCPTTTFAREFFKKHNCEQYWDIAQTDAILQSADS